MAATMMSTRNRGYKKTTHMSRPATESDKKLGKAYHMLRLKSRITLADAAEACGLSGSQLSRYYNGDRWPTSDETVEAMCKAIKCTVQELYTEAGLPVPAKYAATESPAPLKAPIVRKAEDGQTTLDDKTVKMANGLTPRVVYSMMLQKIKFSTANMLRRYGEYGTYAGDTIYWYCTASKENASVAISMMNSAKTAQEISCLLGAIAHQPVKFRAVMPPVGFKPSTPNSVPQEAPVSRPEPKAE